MDVHDLINVDFVITQQPDLPQIWRMPLFVGSKKVGLPENGFGTLPDGSIKRTKVVSSLDAMVELGILTTSEIYKVANTWFSNGGQQITLGFVNTTTVEEVETEESFEEALQAIKQQNNKFYGIIPVFASDEAKANIVTACMQVAAFCSANTKMASFVMRDVNDFTDLTTDDLGSRLKTLNYSCCFVSGDIANADNHNALNTVALTRAMMAQRGQYDLSWKGGDWQGVETSELLANNRTAMDGKNISYLVIDEYDQRTYFLGKTPSGRSACVQMDIDYAKIKLQNRLYTLFKTEQKVPNNKTSQLVIEMAIKEQWRQLQQEGVFEPCTKAEIAQKFFGGLEDNVKGYDPNYGIALYMPDITQQENTPGGVYTGIILYTKINNVIYGIKMTVRGSLN